MKQENSGYNGWHVCNSTAVLMPLSVLEQKKFVIFILRWYKIVPMILKLTSKDMRHYILFLTQLAVNV